MWKMAARRATRAIFPALGAAAQQESTFIRRLKLPRPSLQWPCRSAVSSIESETLRLITASGNS